MWQQHPTECTLKRLALAIHSTNNMQLSDKRTLLRAGTTITICVTSQHSNPPRKPCIIFPQLAAATSISRVPVRTCTLARFSSYLAQPCLPFGQKYVMWYWQSFVQAVCGSYGGGGKRTQSVCCYWQVKEEEEKWRSELWGTPKKNNLCVFILLPQSITILHACCGHEYKYRWQEKVE